MALTEIEILRLEHGDTDLEYPILTDDEYQYYLGTFPNKKKRSKAIDFSILNSLSYDVRERSGQEERYANQAFQQRLELLDKKYKDPVYNGGASTPLAVGGVFKDEMADLATDPNRVPDTFIKGQYRGFPEWQTTRLYYYCGTVEPYNNFCLYYPYIVLVWDSIYG